MNPRLRMLLLRYGQDPHGRLLILVWAMIQLHLLGALWLYRHQVVDAELMQPLLLVTSLLVLSHGVFIRSLADEARLRLLPSVLRPLLASALWLQALGTLLPLALVAARMHLDLPAALLVILAMILAGLAFGWMSGPWRGPLGGRERLRALVTHALPVAVWAGLQNAVVVHWLIPEPGELSPPAHRGLLAVLTGLVVGLVTVLALAIAQQRVAELGGSLRRSDQQRYLSNLSMAPLPAASGIGLGSSPLSQIRHCSAGWLPDGRPVLLACTQLLMTVAAAVAVRLSGYDLHGVLPLLTSEVLTMQLLLTGEDAEFAKAPLRQDALRPWTRRRWALMIPGALLWKRLPLLAALWLAGLPALCLLEHPRLHWLAWMALSLAVQPLMTGLQTLELSLPLKAGRWVKAVWVCAVILLFGVDAGALSMGLGRSHWGVWSTGAWMALLFTLTGLGVGLLLMVYRRWMRLDLR